MTVTLVFPLNGVPVTVALSVQAPNILELEMLSTRVLFLGGTDLYLQYPSGDDRNLIFQMRGIGGEGITQGEAFGAECSSHVVCLRFAGSGANLGDACGK